MEEKSKIIHKISQSIRLVDGNTHRPIDGAALINVSSGATNAIRNCLKKPGGYYIFTEKHMEDFSIAIHHPDYERKTVIVKKENETYYLKRKFVDEVEQPKFVLKEAATKGDEQLSLYLYPLGQNIIFDGCKLVSDAIQLTIATFDATTGTCTLEAPLKKDLPTATPLQVQLPE